MSFLLNMASRFLPAISGLASRAVPALTSAFAVGKQIIPRVIGAVGKIQNAFNTAKQIGKAVKSVSGAVAPEITKKVEDAYNTKIGGKFSMGDIIERGEKGLAKASGIADNAKAVFANIPVLGEQVRDIVR
jgi:hypothetical protein